MVAGVRNRLVPHTGQNATAFDNEFDFGDTFTGNTVPSLTELTPVEVASSLCLLVGIMQVHTLNTLVSGFVQRYSKPSSK